ncbi:MAG: ABC transporter permease subunit, partial [Planctomycetes bacterium]|nr:ABC transporter permease subunit [Planctomycetota bacterium]
GREEFSAVPARLLQVSATLGASPWRIFREVELPLAKRGLSVGLLLAFARGISEYGATAVVAGVIPGRTETLATGLMRRLANGDDDGALALAGVSVGVGFLAVLLSERLLRREAGR